jgi:hypothetical protein
MQPLRLKKVIARMTMPVPIRDAKDFISYPSGNVGRLLSESNIVNDARGLEAAQNGLPTRPQRARAQKRSGVDRDIAGGAANGAPRRAERKGPTGGWVE